MNYFQTLSWEDIIFQLRAVFRQQTLDLGSPNYFKIV